MSNYVITFYNRGKKEWLSEDIQRLTFPEAVGEAYKRKSKRGFDWEITCVAKTVK